MSRIQRLEREIKRSKTVIDCMDSIFGVIYVTLIVVAAIICPIMVRL